MRHIARETYADEWFGQLPMRIRILWLGLITAYADDQGRMSLNPALIRNTVFPYDADVTIQIIAEDIASLTASGKLLEYTVGVNGTSKRYLQVVNWWRYQKGAQWAAASRFPAPNGWTDRVRSHAPGCGTKPVKTNWEMEGGMHSGYVAASLPLRSREDEEEDNEEEEDKRTNRLAASAAITPAPKSAAADAGFKTILQAMGATAKQIKALQSIKGLTQEDLWAMLAFTHSLNKFNKPGWITAENLLQGDRASADWYAQEKWIYVPKAIREKCGLVISRDDTESETSPSVAIRISEEVQPVLDVGKFPTLPVTEHDRGVWQSALAQILSDTPRSSMSTQISDTVLIGHADGVITIGARAEAVDWLTSRATKTVQRLLAGCFDEQVQVRFVAPVETEGASV